MDVPQCRKLRRPTTHIHTHSLPNTPTLSIELHATSYLWQNNPEIDKTRGFRRKISYKWRSVVTCDSTLASIDLQNVNVS